MLFRKQNKFIKFMMPENCNNWQTDALTCSKVEDSQRLETVLGLKEPDQIQSVETHRGQMT